MRSPRQPVAITARLPLEAENNSMVTTLSRLVEMIERGTVPVWLRDEITAKKEQIAIALREGGEIALLGPNGERVTIRAEKQVIAA